MTDKSPNIDLSNESENTPSTSTTPSKSPSNPLDDSGISPGLITPAGSSPSVLSVSVTNNNPVKKPSGVVRSLNSTLKSIEHEIDT